MIEQIRILSDFMSIYNSNQEKNLKLATQIVKEETEKEN